MANIIDLIYEVKKRPMLYNEQLEEYKGNESKQILWAQIAEKLCHASDQDTVEKLKLKWKYIRNAYVKSYKAYLTKKETNPNAKPPQYHSGMEFILAHVKPRRRRDKSEQLLNVFEDIYDAGDLEPLNKKLAPSSNKNDERIEISLTQIKREKSIPATERSDSRVEYSGKDDETEIFFRSIAKTVRRLQPINQALVKKTVANIVMDVEMRETRENSKSTSKNNCQ